MKVLSVDFSKRTEDDLLPFTAILDVLREELKAGEAVILKDADLAVRGLVTRKRTGSLCLKLLWETVEFQ